MTDRKLSEEVWESLLVAMRLTVTEFHPSVIATPFDRKDLIQGTAVFPGGCGLWRGADFYGSIPVDFPAAPIMFVAHNFDKRAGFERSRQNGREAAGPFWKGLRLILEAGEVPLTECFFTNLLMGLQPLKATGKMPSTPLYLQQCDEFFSRQIELVRPRLIVALGDDVDSRLALLTLPVPYIKIKHPSALTYIKAELRDLWISDQARVLRSATPTRSCPAAWT